MRFKDFTAKATNNSGFAGSSAMPPRSTENQTPTATPSQRARSRAPSGRGRTQAAPVPMFYGHNMDDPDRLITSQIDTAPKSNDAVIEGGAPLRESAQSRHRYH